MKRPYTPPAMTPTSPDKFHRWALVTMQERGVAIVDPARKLDTGAVAHAARRARLEKYLGTEAFIAYAKSFIAYAKSYSPAPKEDDLLSSCCNAELKAVRWFLDDGDGHVLPILGNYTYEGGILIGRCSKCGLDDIATDPVTGDSSLDVDRVLAPYKEIS